MNDEPNPQFDAIHPSGAIMARSVRGGCLHSVVLTEDAMLTDANSLAEAILLTASVSHMKAVVLELRPEIIAGTPSTGASDSVPTQADLDESLAALSAHELPRVNR